VNNRNDEDRRCEPRRNYSGFIFFAAHNRVSEGILQNFSRSGLFILSEIRVEIGDCITIALPYTDDKRSGRIVWRNPDGFGVALEGGLEATSTPSRLYHRISSRVIRLFRNTA
jgi:hypothetical protein